MSMNVTKIAGNPIGFPPAPSHPRTKGSAEAPAPAAQPAAQEPTKAMLTNDEKAYFEQLFPGAAREIRSYPSYGESGTKDRPVLGTHIDRKG
jgi:hypothetical protein